MTKLIYKGTTSSCFTNGLDYEVVLDKDNEGYYVVIDDDGDEIYAHESYFE